MIKKRSSLGVVLTWTVSVGFASVFVTSSASGQPFWLKDFLCIFILRSIVLRIAMGESRTLFPLGSLHFLSPMKELLSAGPLAERGTVRRARSTNDLRQLRGIPNALIKAFRLPFCLRISANILPVTLLRNSAPASD